MRRPAGGPAADRGVRRTGFTLLEMLVATAIMGIAVVALLSGLSTSMRNAARLAGHERAALLAKQKLEELLIDSRLPQAAVLEGRFPQPPEAGWRAQIQQFEAPPDAGPGAPVLQRIAVEVWWQDGERRKTLGLDGYRRVYIPQP